MASASVPSGVWLRRLLCIGLGVELLRIATDMSQYALLGDPERLAIPGVPEANDRRMQIVGVLQLVLYLVTVVFFGRWIVRAHRAVRALGAEGLTISPGWAVGYFFIPFLNLVRPYRAMKELWSASESPSGWASTPASSILPLWWTLWLVGNFLDNISMRWNPEDIDGWRDYTLFDIFSAGVSIALAIVAIKLVAGISDRIAARAAEEPPPVPAPVSVPMSVS